MKFQHFEDTFWMARRYAEGRMTYAASTVNDAYDSYCRDNGTEWVHEDTTLKNWPYATDGHLGTIIGTEEISRRPYWPEGKEVTTWTKN